MAYPVRDSLSGYPQQYPIFQSRAHQAQSQSAASSLSINPYAGFTSSVQHQHGQDSATRSSLSTGSPTSEDGSRPSLPSISNLLGIADGDRSGQDSGKCITLTYSIAHAHSLLDARISQPQLQQAQRQAQPISIERQMRHSHSSQDLSSSQRTAIPPTPPLRNDSVVDHTQSPSTISTGSSLSAQPYFLGSGLNNVEADHQRVTQANFIKRHSVPSQPNTSPYGTSPYTTSPYTSSPGNGSTGSYYSPTAGQFPVSNLYHQRPLPSNFPPPPPSAARKQRFRSPRIGTFAKRAIRPSVGQVVLRSTATRIRERSHSSVRMRGVARRSVSGVI